ncbi:MAG: cation-translocating P-type ATPase [Syntrophobacteraceae bacterium]
MIEIIHAVIAGRTRFRVKELYRSSFCKEKLEFRLLEQEAIKAAAACILTGNILVRYNSGNTPYSIAQLIESIISDIKGDLEKEAVQPASRVRGPVSLTFSEKPPSGGLNKDRVILKQFDRLRRPEQQPLIKWHTKSADEALSAWNASAENGLSASGVQVSIRKYGYNVLPESVGQSRLSIFLSQFQSLPVALLGVAAGISLLTGGVADTIVIIGVVGINACVGYMTESEAEKTIQSLKRVVRPTALVRREGRQVSIDIKNIVPGDILVLRPGTYVPADSRLIESEHLSVDESSLTGESLPVLKTTKSTFKDDVPLGDRKNMIYMGTLVTGGQGLAVVVATGRFTELGELQMLVGEAQAPETPMERELTRVGNQLVLISGVICGVVFLFGFIRGAGFLQVLKTSIALAVAAVPEGLPAVATTTLALGIRNMKKQNVLIRRLDAVETLGAVQTICFDKTGTVTQNKMSVQRITTGAHRIELQNGKSSPDILDQPGGGGELSRLLRVCVLCNESEIIKEGVDYLLHGSSTENALIQVALQAGQDVVELRRQYRLVRINHRSEDRHFMGTLHEGPGGLPLFSLKGSPLEVLDMCAWYLKDQERVPLTDDIRDSIEMENELMAGDALRVLGFAFSDVSDGSALNDLNGLTWLGLVGMADPIRDGVKDLIPLFHNAGIDTIMITGDQSSTAYSIGKELGLSGGGPLEILDSTQLSGIDPEALRALSQQVHVFARVSPANKLQIVQALQRSGRIVAMTGDGINDGPALKAADIGVALGASGTDVAREVADVILEKDDLETMILAVSHGRTIYGNIRKSLNFLLATNFSEIMVMFAAGAIGTGYPLSARQLLWINLISDIFPGLALAMEAPESDVLKRPPRDPREPIVKKSDYKRISFEAAMMSGGALFAYLYGVSRFGAGPQAGTLAFQTLTLTQLLHAISCRSERHSIFGKEKLPPNKYLNLALGGSLAIQLLTMFVPGLRALLGTTPMGPADAVVTGISAVVPLLINEARKGIRKDTPA